ncbi:hypothetical protein QVD17_27336 [Tagetes erecta]|uniref:DUF4408 domain-containing protein n=1 Tax=Tagetes erecta TaxID=13708 RepID=A0AAD8KAS0_TARER|nr:hypothetical protein QVD17_27336 [Tagetes erecta]
MEKSNAILKYWMLQKLMNLLRFIEIFVFFVAISKFSIQLPSAVHVSAGYFKGISITIFSPKFVFVISNLIILTLLIKSRVDENGDCIRNTDMCYDYVKSYDVSVMNCASSYANVIVASNKRKMCRSKSENRIKVQCGDRETHRELRRSVTELSRLKKLGDAAEVDVGDKLSGEDFRRTVEAFIARQQKLLRDEEFSPMIWAESSDNHSTTKSSLHPAYTITNINSKVRTLDGNKVTYSSWLKLFEIQATAFRVLDHIDGTTTAPKPTDDNYVEWRQIDALVP